VFRFLDYRIGILNDMWRFNISSTEWTWLSGNSTKDAYGVYGTKATSSTDNYPGARREFSIVFDTILKCIYLFGGSGYAQSGISGGFAKFFLPNPFPIPCRQTERFLEIQSQQH